MCDCKNGNLIWSEGNREKYHTFDPVNWINSLQWAIEFWFFEFEKNIKIACMSSTRNKIIKQWSFFTLKHRCYSISNIEVLIIWFRIHLVEYQLKGYWPDSYYHQLLLHRHAAETSDNAGLTEVNAIAIRGNKKQCWTHCSAILTMS